MSNIKSVFACNLDNFMKERSISRRKLSTDLDIKYTTLCDWINGNSEPRFQTIEKISEYLGVSPSEFFIELSDNHDSSSRLKRLSLEEYSKKTGREIKATARLSFGKPVGDAMFDISFYKNKNILITGTTGFKGTWMCKALLMAGARVTGYALEAPTSPALFDLMGFKDTIVSSIENLSVPESGQMQTIIGDVTDLDTLMKVFNSVQPEIVIHMAAQPIVRESYKNPVGTYATNVMGTVNVLECIRLTESVKSFVNVTTDKVYHNREWAWGYREDEELNGFDPYSNSKSCSELVTSSYKNSFFSGSSNARSNGSPIAISTMRAGNVIGGGDFATDRIIPDCIRAAEAGKEIVVRNPYSTRPYQHVLEPIMAYLMVAAKQYEDASYAGAYNVGPDEEGCYTTGNLVNLFCDRWNKLAYSPISWVDRSEANAPHEANFLKLDCTKLKNTFDWQPVWKLETAMEKIVEWSAEYMKCAGNYESLVKITEKQIREYIQ